MLGEPNFVGLTSGLKGHRSLEQYGHEVLPGLLIVPTGPVPSDPALLENERFVEIVRGLEAGRDAVVLDAPGAGGGVARQGPPRGAGRVLSLTYPHPPPHGGPRGVHTH